MVDAICTEIELSKDFFLENTSIDTIYFGGGTPSILSEYELSQIFIHLHQYFNISPLAEITLEANPEDLSLDYLNILSRLGVNRLSIGIQSFEDGILKWMNRNHNASQAISCVQQAQQTGIQNISIDLIFGSPHLLQHQWEADLRQAISLNIPHLSVYALTVEHKTALAHQVNKGIVQIPEDNTYAYQFLFAHQFLENHHFAHYELSNYALEGFHSQHNSSYWQQIPYLGLGPSAHSFDGKYRRWNMANNARYIQNLEMGNAPMVEQELLSIKDKYHEYIMTGLRQKKGIDLVYIQDKFGVDMKRRFGPLFRKWETQSLLIFGDNHCMLTPEGWLISDQIISDLFIA